MFFVLLHSPSKVNEFRWMGEMVNMSFKKQHNVFANGFRCKSVILSFQVTVHRVVNIVERRSPLPRLGLDYDHGFHDDQWYGGPRNYPDDREFQRDGNYPPNDCQYFDENLHFASFRRNPSPPPSVRQDNIINMCICITRFYFSQSIGNKKWQNSVSVVT